MMTLAAIMIPFFILTVGLTYGYVSRKNKEKPSKRGCLQVLYDYMKVLSITAFSLGFTFMLIENSTTKIRIISNGIKYEGVVVSHTSELNDNNEYMYSPIVEFVTINNETIRHTLDYSSGGKSVNGEKYTVYYDKYTDSVTMYNSLALSLLLGGLCIVIIIDYIFIGIVLYALGKPVKRYWNVGLYIGLKLVLPIIFLLFAGGLMYGLFDNDEMPMFVRFLLVLFILGLGWASWAFFNGVSIPDKEE